MKVSDILKDKGSRIMTIAPTETLAALAKSIRSAGVGAMIVSHGGGSLDGIISERDIAYGLAAHGGKLHELPVSELMTKSVITCSPEDTIAEVAKIMIVRRIRHLPVKQGNTLLGIISIGDVLKSRLSEMELESDVLRDIAIARR